MFHESLRDVTPPPAPKVVEVMTHKTNRTREMNGRTAPNVPDFAILHFMAISFQEISALTTA